MKRIVVVLLLLLGLSSIGQTKTDSLISSLSKANEFREKSNTLYRIYWKFVYSNPDSALGYCRQVLELGKENNNDSIIAKSYNLTGIVYDVVSISDTALLYYDSAMKYARLAKDTGLIAGIHNNTGLIHWNNGVYDKAIAEYLKAESIYLEINRKKGLATCYGNIGLIYRELSNYDKALSYQNKALVLHQELNNLAGENNAKLNIAVATLDDQNVESILSADSLALLYLKENEIYYLSQSNYYALGKVYSILAAFYSEQNQADSAFLYEEKAIEAYRKVGAKNLLASSLFNSSFYLVKAKNERDKAKERVLEAYDLVKETGSQEFLHKITYHLANIYSGEGNFEEATVLYRKSIKLNDSLFSKERQEIVYEMEAKYESEKKENEINRQKALLLESDLTSFKKQRVINALIASLFLVGLFGFFFVSRRRRLALEEKERAIQIERERGLKSVIESQEQERERIAKDLHDGVIQQLVSLKFGMDSLKGEESKKMIAQLDNATYELRDLSHDLMPKNLEKFGLNEAIQHLFQFSFEHTSISYSYDSHGLTGRLSKELELNIYRITQELIHNAIKHSKATAIDAQLYQIESILYFIFEDNGHGFDVQSSKNGIGMQSMQSRMKLINGTIHFESNSNAGTIITINIPLKNHLVG